MSPRSIEIARLAPRLALYAALALLGACAASGPPAERARGGDAAAVARPRAADAPEEVRRAYNAALAAIAAEHWAEAERLLETLVREHPEYAGPHVNLAILYRRDGRADDAREALNAALEIDPMHPQANNELGILLRLDGDFEAAEAAYRRALEADPDYALAHYNLGVLLDLYLDRRPEALEQYERFQALSSEPDQTVAGWIIDLRRRLEAAEKETARVAQEDRS